VIVFVDESGVKTRCNCVAVGVVAFEATYGRSYLEVGSWIVDAIKRVAKVGGELKWRDVERRGVAEFALGLIRSAATYVNGSATHFLDFNNFANFVMGLIPKGTRLVVLDHQLLPRNVRLGGARIVERDSRRVPGLQLADIVAGYHRRALCRA